MLVDFLLLSIYKVVSKLPELSPLNYRYRLRNLKIPQQKK